MTLQRAAPSKLKNEVIVITTVTPIDLYFIDRQVGVHDHDGCPGQPLAMGSASAAIGASPTRRRSAVAPAGIGVVGMGFFQLPASPTAVPAG